VIPRSLGTFHPNLTVGCVCGECNNYFSKHLELQLARESPESVVRYQYGLRKGTAAQPHSKITARINVPGPMFGAKVVLGPNATKDGFEIFYLPQVAIQAKASEEWKWYLEEDLNEDVVKALGPGAGIKYFVTTKIELERLRSRMQNLVSSPTEVVKHDQIPPQPKLKIEIAAGFNSNVARCVAKIGFNYLAYATNEDGRLLLQEEFDEIRNYVRYQANPKMGLLNFSTNPKLDAEERKGSLVDGHILAVDWDPTGEKILCVVNLFGAMSYQISLCRGYSGVWFPIGSAHFFDFRNKATRKVPLRHP